MQIKSELARIVLNKLAWAQINESVNMVNVRLKRLAKVFGRTSKTFQKEVAFMQKGALQDYLGTSKAGDLKVDYMKIKKALQSGKTDINSINEVLSRMAGVKITESGEVVRTGSQVPTVGQLRTEAREKMQEMGVSSDYNVDKFIEEMNKFASEFQSSYNDTVKDVGAEEMENDAIVGQLWSQNRRRQGKLSYNDLAQIMKRMEEMRVDAYIEEGWVENDQELPF